MNLTLILSHAGTMQDLGTLRGTNSTALAINASSQVVGTSATSNVETHVFSGPED